MTPWPPATTDPGAPEGAGEQSPAEADRACMRRLAAGDGEALAPLMERHYRRLYRVALAYLRNPDDALEAVQETFVKAYVGAARWDARAEVGPWLTRIAVNHAIDRYRSARRRRRSEEPLGEGDHDSRLVSGLPGPELSAERRELARRLDAALSALSPRQRAVLVLRHYEEMTLPEIAEALRLNLGTVKSTLHRGVERLKERLARGRQEARP